MGFHALLVEIINILKILGYDRNEEIQLLYKNFSEIL